MLSLQSRQHDAADDVALEHDEHHQRRDGGNGGPGHDHFPVGLEFAGQRGKPDRNGIEAGAGGDLGFVSPGFMPEEIDAAIFSQRPGEIGPVIRSPFGYHIFRIIEKEKKARKGWDDIREHVLTDLRKLKEEREYALWLGALRSKAVIKINGDLLKNAGPQINEAE